MPTNSDRFVTRHASLTAISVLLAALLAANGSVTPVAAQSYNCSANPAVASVTPKYANRFFRVISTISNLYPIQNWAADTRLQPVLTPLRTEGRCKASWAITAVSAVEMAYALVADSVPSMAPPQRLSLQQVLDCSYSTSSNCIDGGWLTAAALDYMVDATRQWGCSQFGCSQWGCSQWGCSQCGGRLIATAPIQLSSPTPQTPQVIDCNNSSSNCVDGGWPTAALDYMVDATRQWGASPPRHPSSRTCRGRADASGASAHTHAPTPMCSVCAPMRPCPCHHAHAPSLCAPCALSATTIGITGYDQVDFYSWFGLLLAVNTQPTIAFVQGSYPSFQTYTQGIYQRPRVVQRQEWVDSQRAGDGVAREVLLGSTIKWAPTADAGCAVAGVVDHSVVVMGYSITADSAFWILRNSWGATWGMQGYMQMAFEGGVGICGIHSVPALYPIIKTPSPCLSPQNPCGGGTCQDLGNGQYTCMCEEPYFIAAHTDFPLLVPPFFSHFPAFHHFSHLPSSSRPSLPITTHDLTLDLSSLPLPPNPSNFPCASSPLPRPLPLSLPPPLVPSPPPTRPLPLSLFPLALSHLPSPHSPPPTSPLPTRPFPLAPCQLTCAACRMTIPVRSAQHGPLRDHPQSTYASVLPPLMGSVQCGLFYSWPGHCERAATPHGSVQCGLFYSWTANDTCKGVAGLFSLTVAGFLRLNPGINCTSKTAWNAPTVNQQLCVALGNGADLPMCTAWYTVIAGDISSSPPLGEASSLPSVAAAAAGVGMACSPLPALTSFPAHAYLPPFMLLSSPFLCSPSSPFYAPIFPLLLLPSSPCYAPIFPPFMLPSSPFYAPIFPLFMLPSSPFYAPIFPLLCSHLPFIPFPLFMLPSSPCYAPIFPFLCSHLPPFMLPSSPFYGSHLPPFMLPSSPFLCSHLPLLCSQSSPFLLCSHLPPFMLPSSPFYAPIFPTLPSSPFYAPIFPLLCSHLPPSILPSSFCAPRPSIPIAGRQLAVSKAPCLKYYYVTKGDMCARIITLKFQNSAQKLSELNNGYVCVNSKLYVGLSLCTRR
ncbi:unnamed protein product [Closterium sp. NIES-64]|nr:unnamed protein product [Closterium sp. NIES-64]